jgi:hypothetical protein
MKYLIVAFFVLSFASMAQIKIEEVDKSSIPDRIDYKGDVVAAYSWNDSKGKNFLLVSESGVFTSPAPTQKDFDEHDAEVYAYQYTIKYEGPSLVWKLLDFSRNCDVDVAAKYIMDSIEITDLDTDGTAETWLMYTLSCRSDASPSSLKLIMHEGEKKYAIRGSSRVKTGVSDKGADEFFGGEKKVDETFKKGPSEFLKYALTLWDKFVVERWD